MVQRMQATARGDDEAEVGGAVQQAPMVDWWVGGREQYSKRQWLT